MFHENLLGALLFNFYFLGFLFFFLENHKGCKLKMLLAACVLIQFMKFSKVRWFEQILSAF